MAQSTTDIQKKSDEKRGVKVKGFKLTIETIALIEKLAEQTGKPQAIIVTEAIQNYASKLEQS